MSQMFISYKRVNKDIVFPIVEEIKRKLGISPWIDLEGIESGAQFSKIIVQAIKECDIVLFMMSKESIAPSENEDEETWTQKELYQARKYHKKIVPVNIDGTDLVASEWYDLDYGRLDSINYQDEDQRTKLFNNLRTWLNIPDDESVKQEIEDLKTQWEANNAQLKELSVEQDRCLQQILEREKRIGDNSASKAIMSQDQASVGNGSMQMMMQMMSTMMQMQKPAASQASEEVEEGLMIERIPIPKQVLDEIDRITQVIRYSSDWDKVTLTGNYRITFKRADYVNDKSPFLTEIYKALAKSPKIIFTNGEDNNFIFDRENIVSAKEIKISRALVPVNVFDFISECYDVNTPSYDIVFKFDSSDIVINANEVPKSSLAQAMYYLYRACKFVKSERVKVFCTVTCHDGSLIGSIDF